MQHEITAKQRLLDSNGNIAEPGFAKKLLWEYNRNDITAPKIRIKEWDYYYIGTQDYGLCLTISDAGYVSCLSVSFLQFGEKPVQMNDSEIGVLPLGKLNLPPTSEAGNIHAKVGTADMSFLNNGKERRLYGSYDNYCNTKKCLVFDITLTDMPEESMVIATPFDKDKHFYYNQKINCMRASGTVKYGDEVFELNPETDFAGLDWGRGVWTRDNVWYWGSGSGQIDGVPFGFNIGYGFGDTSAASENVIFYNGIANKFDDVVFNISDNYTDPWTIKSSDGRFDMDFTPIIDRSALIDVKVIVTDQHQVFGKMNGTAILDDGTKIELKDFVCFAEKVHNKY